MSLNSGKEMMWGGRKLIWLFLSFFFFFLFGYSFFFPRNVPNHLIMGQSGADAIEFQTIAVNFAVYNSFPLMGYVGGESKYLINEDEKSLIQSAGANVIKMFRQCGPVVFLSQTPAYSFLLGIIYKIFGVNLFYARLFNLLLLAATSGLLVYGGAKLGNLPGAISGIIAGVILIIVQAGIVVNIDSEILTSFAIAIAFVISINLRKASKLNYFVFGISLGFLLLVKTIATFVPLLYIVYLLIRERPLYPKAMSLAAMMIVGIGLILVPWIAFANYVRISSADDRNEWKARNDKSSPDLPYLWSLGINNSMMPELPLSSPAIEYLIRSRYSEYAGAQDFIFIRSQMDGNQLLDLHNEFCADGTRNPQWRIFKDSYYNTKHLNNGPVSKIAHFYLDNIRMCWVLPFAKLKASTNSSRPFLWIAAVMFGLYSIKNYLAGFVRSWRLYQRYALASLLIIISAYSVLHIMSTVSIVVCLSVFITGVFLFVGRNYKWLPLIVPLIILNYVIIIPLGPGNPRFFAETDCLTLFSSVYCCYLLLL